MGGSLCLLSVGHLTSMHSLDCHCRAAGLMVLSPLYEGGDQYSEKKRYRMVSFTC